MTLGSMMRHYDKTEETLLRRTCNGGSLSAERDKHVGPRCRKMCNGNCMPVLGTGVKHIMWRKVK